MSTWGVESYTHRERPILEQTIQNNNPPFFIANVGSLDIEKQTSLKNYKQYELLEADLHALTANYIHHWGKLYVAGKQFYLSETRRRRNFFIHIQGIYTLESSSPALINGRRLLPLESIYLAQGSNSIQTLELPGKYTLRWGEQLYRPAYQPSEGKIFNGF